MGGYIGNQPVPHAVQNRQTFTATEGQTSFATSGYTPQFIDVYLNGVKLVRNTDYDDSNGSDIVLTEGANAGDTLEAISYKTYEVSDQHFTGVTRIDNLALELRSDFPSVPEEGVLTYRTDLGSMFIYDGSVWTEV